MAAVQMNVRMDSELKRTGDAVLEMAGFTPTEAVRELWGFAQRNAGDIQRITGLFDILSGHADMTGSPTETIGPDNRRQGFENWAKKGTFIIADACRELGIDASAVSVAGVEDYNRLLEKVYDEELERWEATS